MEADNSWRAKADRMLTFHLWAHCQEAALARQRANLARRLLAGDQYTHIPVSKEGQMLSQRNTHYWLWFLLFGVVSALVTASKGEGITTETMWLLIAGFFGLILGALLPSLARPYDLVIGLLFTTVGLLGILHNFGLNLVGQPNALAPNAIDETAILGLSLSLPYALIHTVLGLTSLSHGLRAKVATSRVAVATPVAVE
jgi:hypothetical protein